MLSLDVAGLEFVIKGGSKKLHDYAKRIYKVRKHGNWLLCTLLLGNVAVNSALTILVDQAFGENVRRGGRPRLELYRILLLEFVVDGR